MLTYEIKVPDERSSVLQLISDNENWFGAGYMAWTTIRVLDQNPYKQIMFMPLLIHVLAIQDQESIFRSTGCLDADL